MIQLQHVFDTFSRLKVMIVGDVMIDSYLWGHTDRISPEAPVPVITCTQNEYRPGGAANVALNIESLGGRPVLCTVIGNDDSGLSFLSMMQAKGISTEGITFDPLRTTTVKTRIISNGQQMLRVDRETDAPLSEEMERRFIERVRRLLKAEHFDAVVFEDYDKGAITPAVITETVAAAGELGIPVLVDPKKRNFNHYRNITLFKPNFKELTEGLELRIGKTDTDALFQAVQTFQKEKDIRNMLVTLSEAGMFLSDADGYRAIPAERRDVADVSGAGDTVIATAALCLAAGLPPYETAVLANLAGGLVCEKVGVVPIDRTSLWLEASRKKELFS